MVLKLFTDTGSYALPTEPTWRKSVNQGTTRHVRSFPRSWAGLAGPGDFYFFIMTDDVG
jgi:hypothetical protein